MICYYVDQVRCNLIPLTGTVTPASMCPTRTLKPMQPYTPHGDSNPLLYHKNKYFVRCNLIPLTGTVTIGLPVGNGVDDDATLYPSRGQ